MRSIAVIASANAEFGLLMPVVKELCDYEDESLKGDGHASEQIAGKIVEVVTENKIDLKKFFDLEDSL